MGDISNVDKVYSYLLVLQSVCYKISSKRKTIKEFNRETIQILFKTNVLKIPIKAHLSPHLGARWSSTSLN